MSGHRERLIEEIEAIPENLLREPLDYISSDHFRQRTICKFLDDIAFDPTRSEVAHLAAIVLTYLEQDLPHHIADEEQNLFPRLRERCLDSDKVDRLLAVLSEEHAKDDHLCTEILVGLRALSNGQNTRVDAGFVRAAAAFAETQRRHLAWEDEVLLPLARQRLTAEDLRDMGRSLAARRGVHLSD